MGEFFKSKSFNPEAFGKYVDNVPNVKRNQLAKSEALGTNDNARKALATQTGSLHATVPYFGRISGKTSQNNDGNTNVSSNRIGTFEQGFIVASRMDSWTETSFAKNITSGVAFMDNVASQISEYKFEVLQGIMLSMLKGAFSMKTTGTGVRNKAAKEFIKTHTYDKSGVPGISADTLNQAIQKACGDNKEIFKLVIMHSSVSTELESMKLLTFLKYTDAEGITRDLAIATWNGRIVLVDDNIPTEEVEATYKKTADTEVDTTKTYYILVDDEYEEVLEPKKSELGNYYEVDKEGYTKYTSYILGKGSIVADNIGDEVPYEMSRDPRTNGGEDTLFVRDRYICGLEGLTFIKPVSLTASASNEDLENGDNWAVIHNANEAIPVKSIPITRLITRG